jgi:hypothetical protein
MDMLHVFLPIVPAMAPMDMLHVFLPIVPEMAPMDILHAILPIVPEMAPMDIPHIQQFLYKLKILFRNNEITCWTLKNITCLT